MKNILLLTSLFSALLLIAKADLIDLTESNYEDFTQNNKIHLINLCSSQIAKCKTLRNTLREVSEKSEKEVGIKVNVGVIDVDTQKELAEKYIWEGFPTLFYVNAEGEEKEPFLASKVYNKIMKYLKFKLVQNIENKSNERELEESLKRENVKIAPVLIGDSKRSPFTTNFLAKACKQAGLNKLYVIENEELMLKLKIDEYDVAFYNTKTHSYQTLNLPDEDDLSLQKLTKILLINKRNLQGHFQFLKAIDLEYSLQKDIPTLFYIYGERKHLSSALESDIVDLAKRYKNEFLFFKSSINNKPLRQIDFSLMFNITKDDLPALVLTAENIHTGDDVEKYIVRASELTAYREKTLKQQMEAKRTSEEETTQQPEPNELITKKTIENMLENFKKGKLYKTYYTETEDVEIKMTGDNFVPVVDEPLEEDKEVVLLICPKISKKYERIKARLMRVFEKVVDVNQGNIIIDELDPFVNELSLIHYKYFPTIAHIKKNPDTFSPNKWIVNIMENKFTNKEIIKFIQAHSQFKINVNNTLDDPTINEDEVQNPVFPILKTRLDNKFLSENLVKFNIGFKRRWNMMKRHGLALSEEDTDEFDNANEWEEDADPDDYASGDSVVEPTTEEKIETKSEL